MKNTLYDRFPGRHLSREMQVNRIRQVIQEDMTTLQRYTLVKYYFENKTLQQIADTRNVKKSTVWRTLKRAEEKIKWVMKY